MSSLAVLGLLALAAFARDASAANVCPSDHMWINSNANGDALTNPDCCYTGFETTGDWKCVKVPFNGVYQVACTTFTGGTFTVQNGAEFTQFNAYLSTAGSTQVGFRQALFQYTGDVPTTQAYTFRASIADLVVTACAGRTSCSQLIMSPVDGQMSGQVLGDGPFSPQTIQGPAISYPARAGFFALSQYDFPCLEFPQEPEPEEGPDDEPVVDVPPREDEGEDDEPVVTPPPRDDEDEDDEPVPVVEPVATVTTYASTQVITETVYTSTVSTPSATVTVIPTSTVTSTPATSTVTETETKEVNLGPEYYTETIDGGITTPPTVTVETSTDVTTTPATTTITATVTPATSTAYATNWTTITPPTKTVTAVQTVYTGHADCTNFRLTFPKECCPSSYVKLRSLKRRALDFDLEKRDGTTVTVDGGVFTTTSTVSETKTIAEGEATITGAATTATEVAAVPLTTTTETETVTLPREQVLRTITAYGEAPTPFFTVTSTNYHAAPTPTRNVQVTAATPVTTVTRQSTTTLPQQTTTKTSTAYAQATTCAVKDVYSQDRCASSKLVENLVQNAQVAALNLYKNLGGKRVIVDCGDAGEFSY
ncbi:hypothetical protein JCM11251_001004 [Rhodosporidiobolus azoricus]